MFNETPIQLLAKIYDQDPEAIKPALDAAGDEAAVVTEPIAKLDAPLRYGVGPIMSAMARAGVPVGIGFKKLLKSYAKEVGSTAVHRAAERGDVQMLKLFKEAADVHAAPAPHRREEADADRLRGARVPADAPHPPSSATCSARSRPDARAAAGRNAKDWRAYLGVGTLRSNGGRPATRGPVP